MAVQVIFTEDTARVRGTFKDYDEVLADPDGNVVDITIYKPDLTVLTTDTASRSSAGSYYYDWTTPSDEGTYIVEFKGEFAGYPQLSRKKFKLKFKPVV
jgi:uncharacterized protein YfaS (alpha-2-macroglobulin family)